MRTILLAAVLVVSCGQAYARTNEVRMLDDPAKPESEWGYDPASIEVALGTVVTFINVGSQFHSVTSDDPTRAFDVGADPGERATVRFDRAGLWTYHCGIHPEMKGAVRVCDGSCP